MKTIKLLISVILIFSPTILFSENWSYMVNPNYINCSNMDGDDLWLGTSGGIVRYNTITAESKNINTTQGLINNYVRAIKLDRDGYVWCTTDYGIWRYDGEKVELIDEEKGLYTIAVDSMGGIWAGSYSGIFKYNGEIFEKEFDEHASSIAFDHDGHLWRTETGLGAFKYEDGEWKIYSTEEGLPTNEITDVYFDSFGNIWFYSDIYGAYYLIKYDGESFKGFPYPVREFADDSLGNIWIASDVFELNMYDGENWTGYTKDFLYPDFFGNELNCYSVSVDSSDKVWVGTKCGIVKVNLPEAAHMILPSDYPNGVTIGCLSIGPDNKVWLGSTYGGIASYNSFEWTEHFSQSPMSWNDPVDFAFKSNGDVWVGVESGIRIYSNGYWELIENADGVDLKDVTSIFFDLEENLWVATKKDGIFQYDGETWMHYPFTGNENEGPAGNRVECGTPDDYGNVWLGGSGGVSLFDRSSWKWFKETDGLISESVKSILVSNDGYLWFGTSSGVSRFDGVDEWISYTTEDGLTSGHIYEIIQDRNGKMWFGTKEGLSKFDGEYWYSYTRENGLPDNKIKCLTEDKDGNIWIVNSGKSAYTDSIAILHPEQEIDYPVINIYTDRDRYSTGDTITISVDGENKSDGRACDLWLVMIDTYQNIYFAPMWDSTPAPALSDLYLPQGFTLPLTTLFEYPVPNGTPPVSDPGSYIFAIGLTDAGTMNFFHVSSAGFEITP